MDDALIDLAPDERAIVNAQLDGEVEVMTSRQALRIYRQMRGVLRRQDLWGQ